jgi:ribosome biogenesis GTPase / thiamine phosphate phosphatase
LRGGGEENPHVAKRKGKSEHRVRDWDRRFTAGERVEDETYSRRKLTRRKVKIPSDRLLAPEENLESLPKIEGMVVGHFPGGVLVRPTASGEAAAPIAPRLGLLCGVAKTYRSAEGSSALVVGDEVTVAMAQQSGEALQADKTLQADKARADGMILARRTRRTVLCRPQIGSGKRHDPYEHQAMQKVVAANMDAMVIVASTVQPPLRAGPIDRFLIVAQRGELAPILAITKIDLAGPDEGAMRIFRDLGVPIARCSAVTGEGLDGLLAMLAGRRCVLAGASGVGKSTLVNAMVPGASAATREVRLKDERGRHTTTAARVYDLPGGGLMIDTPGLREIGIHLTAEELPWYFPEFEPLQSQCRFRDCTHTHEPACAVISAVEAGLLPPRRYASYVRIRESLD